MWLTLVLVGCAVPAPAPDTAVDDVGPDDDTADVPPDVPCETADDDGDGYVALLCGGDDCDDDAPTVHPNAAEFCDGVDEDCDGRTDEGTGRCPVSVAAGNASTWVVRADGTVLFVGYETLWDVPDPPRRFAMNWVPIPELSDVATIEIGRTTCAILRSGRVTCWGDNSTGNLADGTRMSRLEPREIPGLERVVEIGISSSQACALSDTGEVTVWGSSPGGVDCTGCLVELSLHDIVDIAAGPNHACALDRMGAVWCWGRNDLYQLGDGVLHVPPGPFVLSDYSYVPVRALSFGAHAIAISGDTTYAAMDDHVLAWGGTARGLLGAEPEPRGICGGGCSVRHVRVEGLGYVEALDGQGWFTCAVSSGIARCWGEVVLGAPLVSLPMGPTAWPRPMSAWSFSGHSCALSRGELYCWGDGHAFQLGGGVVELGYAAPRRVLLPE